jgi:hypothetical protein
MVDVIEGYQLIGVHNSDVRKWESKKVIHFKSNK